MSLVYVLHTFLVMIWRVLTEIPTYRICHVFLTQFGQIRPYDVTELVHSFCPLAGLKIYFTDGHVDVIGNQEGLQRHSFRLDSGERIIAAHVVSSLLVDRLQFWTNRGRVLGPYGGYGGQSNPKEQHIRTGSFGYLAGINCTLLMTQSQETISNLSFKWLVCGSDDRSTDTESPSPREYGFAPW